MLGISEASEINLKGSPQCDALEWSLKGNNSAKKGKYSSLQSVDESPDDPICDTLMPAEARISASVDWEEDEDETEALKKGKFESIKSQTSYSLPPAPVNYEYPELVKSLKGVYKEMFITIGLYMLNIASAVGIVIVNKLIYTHYKFPHGLILTLYHFLLTSVGLQILALLKFFPIKPVKLIKILPLSVSFCSYVVLTNLSLQYNSGTFYQVIVMLTLCIYICRFWWRQ